MNPLEFSVLARTAFTVTGIAVILGTLLAGIEIAKKVTAYRRLMRWRELRREREEAALLQLFAAMTGQLKR